MKRAILIAAVCVLSVTSAAQADTIIGSSSSSGFVTGWTANNNGLPYWDQTSWDGSNKNVGFCMTGTGGCTMVSGAPGALPTWVGNTATGTWTADPNFYFSSAGGNGNAVLQVEIAGLAGSNILGWFETDATGSLIGTMHQLFAGPDSAGAVAAFAPTAYYGFYLTSSQGTFFTLATLNAVDTNKQHFAVFAPNANNINNEFWIGSEDLRLNSSDKDYNDLVVHITVARVPEPGTLVLFAAGLLGLAAGTRRRARA